MTQYVLLFFNDKGKEVDRIFFNGPVHNFWESEVIRNYAKVKPLIWQNYLKRKGLNETQALTSIWASIDTFNFIMSPFNKFSINETIVKFYTAETFKSSTVTLCYRKSDGWDVEGKDEQYDHIDSKKEYSYVVYGNNDGGELDKKTKTYKMWVEFLKLAIGLADTFR